MERIDQSEILEWRKNRVTQALMQLLQDELTACMNMWAIGKFKNSAIVDAEARGRCLFASTIIELDATTFNGEDDAAPIPEQRDAE